MPAKETSDHASETAEHVENVTTPTAGMTYVASPKVTLTALALEVLRVQILEKILREVKDEEAASQAKKQRASRAASRAKE
ncbi:hypothetical protein B0H65DRAFT_427803 [Neurospora tetraspora]|uniref:Uncharacterized protein n=1 Tax=Neurospora tetraspora TaxID=94610 RepID=A0AAE0MQE7_9PEZI|nr:hypothetical protein B0H65DRAFT_427803 [Neurospora tetraspora]